MRITIKTLKAKLAHVNRIVLKKSVYRIGMEYKNRKYTLFLKTTENEPLETMYVGKAREIYAFLKAFQIRYWYMVEPF